MTEVREIAVLADRLREYAEKYDKIKDKFAKGEYRRQATEIRCEVEKIQNRFKFYHDILKAKFELTSMIHFRRRGSLRTQIKTMSKAILSCDLLIRTIAFTVNSEISRERSSNLGETSGPHVTY